MTVHVCGVGKNLSKNSLLAEVDWFYKGDKLMYPEKSDPSDLTITNHLQTPEIVPFRRQSD